MVKEKEKSKIKRNRRKEKEKTKRIGNDKRQENAGDRQSRRQSRPSGSGDKPTHIQGIF